MSVLQRQQQRPERRIAPAAATVCANGVSPNRARGPAAGPAARPSDLFPALLFRRAAFLAKLYSEAIVLPTVEVSVSSGKGRFDGESGRGFCGRRRLAHRESGRCRSCGSRSTGPSRRNSLSHSMIAIFRRRADRSRRRRRAAGHPHPRRRRRLLLRRRLGGHQRRRRATAPHRRPPPADTPRRESCDRVGAQHPAAGGLQCAGFRGRPRLQSGAGRRLHRGRRRRGVLGAVRGARIQSRTQVRPGCSPD